MSSGNSSAFAGSDDPLVRGWVNDGLSVKTSTALYEQNLTSLEFFNKYGVFLGGGALDVTAFFKFSLHGDSVNGGSVGLRLESGALSDDTRSYISPVGDSGLLTAHLDSCCFLPLKIRINGNVSTGGNSFGSYGVAITEIRYNGDLIFTGPPPTIPEPSSIALTALGAVAVFMTGRRERCRLLCFGDAIE